MIVTTKAIWLAVHRTLSDAGVVRAGQSLGIREMTHAWSLTGLRRRDLVGALESLSRGGFIKIATSANGPRAELVDASFGLLDGGGRDTLAVNTLSRLRELRGRPPHLAQFAQRRQEGRRRDDRAPGPLRATS